MIDSSWNTSWKIWNEIKRRITYPWIRFLFLLNGINWGENWRIFGAPIIQKHRQSEMIFGNNMQLRSTTQSNPLGPYHPVILCTWQPKASLIVGDHFAMTGGSLCASESIQIGDHVTIGANVIIADTDFHPINPITRQNHPNAGDANPVKIGRNVFIGTNSIILKGIEIGENSVIGAGSVVTNNVPPGVIAAGNPARIIKAVEYEELTLLERMNAA